MNMLSRRVAVLMHTPVILDLATERHITFVSAVAATDDFATLPAWAQKTILTAEATPEKFNPYHAPPGSDEGGQFTSAQQAGPGSSFPDWTATPRTASELHGKIPLESDGSTVPMRTIKRYHVTRVENLPSLMDKGFDLERVKPRWANDFAVSLSGSPSLKKAMGYFTENTPGARMDTSKYAVVEVTVKGRFFKDDPFAYTHISGGARAYTRAVTAEGWDGFDQGNAVYVYNPKAISRIHVVPLDEMLAAQKAANLPTPTPAPTAATHGFTTAMLAFFPTVTRPMLSDLPDGSEPVPDADLHVTLAFLGDTDALELSATEIALRVEQAAAQLPVLTGKFGGAVTFTTDDDQQPFCATIDALALQAWRAALLRLTGLDAYADAEHSYTPHMTLAYLPAGAQPPTMTAPDGEIVFDTVALTWDDERYTFPLRGGPVADAGALEALGKFNPNHDEKGQFASAPGGGPIDVPFHGYHSERERALGFDATLETPEGEALVARIMQENHWTRPETREIAREIASNARRGEIKAAGATRLAEAIAHADTLGIGDDDIYRSWGNRVQSDWATTSNDHGNYSDQLQAVALERATHKDGISQTSPGLRDGQNKITYESVKPTVNAAFDSIYNETQQYFRDRGIGPDDEIVVFRGVRLDNQKFADIRSAHAGDTVTHKANPLSSFSLRYDVAQRFVETRPRGQFSTIIAVRIKAKHIFAHWSTGFGCADEDEVVIFGDGLAETPIYKAKAEAATLLELDVDLENADWLLILQREREAAGGAPSDATLLAQMSDAKFNPYHRPAGPGGGQFTSGAGAPTGTIWSQGGRIAVLGASGEGPDEKPADWDKPATTGADAAIAGLDRLGWQGRDIKDKLRAEIFRLDEELRLQFDRLFALDKAGTPMDDPERKALSEIIAANSKAQTKLWGQVYGQDKKTLKAAHKLLEVDDPINIGPVWRDADFKASKVKEIKEGAAFVSRMVSQKAGLWGGEGRQPIRVDFLPTKDARASYDANLQRVNASKSLGVTTVAHELGHFVEDKSPRIAAAARAFLKQRAGNEQPQKLRDLLKDQGYEDYEIAYKDRFEHPYSGKVYKHGATEIVSMGLQKFYEDPIGFARHDPEYFAFIYNTVRGN